MKDKYYYEEKGGHYFIKGLEMEMMVDDRALAEATVEYLREKFGLDETSFLDRVKVYNKVRNLNNKIEMEKLKKRYNPVQLIKIMEEI